MDFPLELLPTCVGVYLRSASSSPNTTMTLWPNKKSVAGLNKQQQYQRHEVSMRACTEAFGLQNYRGSAKQIMYGSDRVPIAVGAFAGNSTWTIFSSDTVHDYIDDRGLTAGTCLWGNIWRVWGRFETTAGASAQTISRATNDTSNVHLDLPSAWVFNFVTRYRLTGFEPSRESRTKRRAKYVAVIATSGTVAAGRVS